jgi:transcriptional regulator with XRE-family HTH domain
MRNLENKYPNKLKELRVKKNLTLREVANTLGLQSENRLCRWERGQSVPSTFNLIKLSEVYGVSANEIYQCAC